MQFLLFSGLYYPRRYLENVFVKTTVHADVWKRHVIYKELSKIFASMWFLYIYYYFLGCEIRMSLIMNNECSSLLREICVQQVNMLGFFVFLLDPFQFFTKSEPAKEQTAQPVSARKPTVIRIPAKPGKCKFFSQTTWQISVTKSF